MSEIDKSVFRIPGLERKDAVDFVAPKAVAAQDAAVLGAAAQTVAQEVVVKEIAPAEIVPKQIVVPKAVTPNLYEELTAISEEILECRSQILETC